MHQFFDYITANSLPLTDYVGAFAAVLGVGAMAGALSGSVAMPGPPVITYFLARPTAAAMNRASLLMFFFFTDIASIATGLVSSIVALHTIIVALTLTPALYIGNKVGHHLFNLASDDNHRRIALGLLTIIALSTLVQTIIF